MKVKVEMKITLLDGEEEGRVFNENSIMETETDIGELGLIERLNIGWRYMHPNKSIRIKEGSCFDCDLGIRR